MRGGGTLAVPIAVGALVAAAYAAGPLPSSKPGAGAPAEREQSGAPGVTSSLPDDAAAGGEPQGVRPQVGPWGLSEPSDGGVADRGRAESDSGTDTVAVRAVVRSTLQDAVDAGAALTLPRGARVELAWRLGDIFEYRVDLSRDLTAGDAVRMLFVRRTGPGGSVNVADVLAVRLERAGAPPLEVIRFPAPGGRGEYVDRSGRSLRSSFLRAPLSFRRVSSGFGMRLHPILGVWRQHRGIDYAAAAGTPIRAVGDGMVIFAGRRGSYGNLVEVRHRGGVITRYAHLRGFDARVRDGSRVRLGQTIGFVGMTGLATAPHLHFEVLVRGTHADPRVALAGGAGESLPWGDQPGFERVRSSLLALLDERAASPPRDRT